MKLLVVEDDARMASLVSRGLRREGWSVDVVRDAVDARHAVESTPYDAVVCDIGLPGPESGLDWCRWLRSSGRWTPVLLLTARSGVEDRIVGLDSGADDYLAKPFAFGELAARLRAVHRRGETPRPVVLRAGALELDPALHQASWAGKPLPLRPREFALLEFFLRRAGDVLSRTEILDHVWDCAYDGTSNVVDVCVGYLRSRLRSAGAPPLVESVRGVGYRLRSDEGHLGQW